MPMTFEEAEAKFRQLQARVQRGESVSRAEYEEEVGKLAVQDRNGTLWEINPRTGKWMYFDGAEWVSGAPPGHENSTVMPVPKEFLAAKETPAAPAPPPSTRPPAPSPVAPARVSAVPPEPPPFVRADQKQKPPAWQKPSAAPPLSGPPGENLTRQSPMGGRNREWVPLAIASVVLLFCAILLFGGWAVAQKFWGSTPTPTRANTLARSPTPLPPVTTMPTSTPIPPTLAPVTAKVTATTLNIRAEASSKTKLVGTLKKDNQVTFLAQAKGEKIEGQDVWYLINLPNSTQQGWVFFGKNFQTLSGDPNTLPVGGAATPTPTKGAAAPPAPAGATPTPTVIGVIPPAPKTYP